MDDIIHTLIYPEFTVFIFVSSYEPFLVGPEGIVLLESSITFDFYSFLLFFYWIPGAKEGKKLTESKQPLVVSSHKICATIALAYFIGMTECVGQNFMVELL